MLKFLEKPNSPPLLGILILSDPDTGALVWGQEISRAAERLVRAREAVQSGEFRPNREKDELTYTLENPEHGGCTRGYGAVPWLQSF